MNWQPEVQEFLENQDYQQIVNLYEEKVELEPEQVEPYLYLGLAYLLCGREEEAQTTWLLAFTAEESSLSQISFILEAEAQRQKSLNNLQLAWLIRSNLQEIDSSLIDNILRLIDLEIDLQIFSVNNLENYNLEPLIKNINLESSNLDLLWNVLPKIIINAQENALPIVEASLTHINHYPYYLDKLDEVARTCEQSQPLLAIKLTELCLKILPNDLYLRKNLGVYYRYAGFYRESVNIAHQNYELTDDIRKKVFLNCIILECLQQAGLWLEYQPIFQRHKVLLNQAIAENKCPGMSQDATVTTTMALLYSEDNPRKNRSLQNQIAKLFQTHTRNQYLQSQSYLSDRHRETADKLRIGYIGHTLKTHSVGWLSRWLFKYHDREKYEIFAYVINQKEDNLTRDWFRENTDKFYNLPCETDKISEQIWADKIDILVDLDSLTNNFTCQVMSLKPASIQVTWLGLDASGIPAIDYFIADPYVLPENAQEYYQEKIWRLPHTYLGIDGFELDVPTLKRKDLDIPENAVIYFNIQNALKRHPDIIHTQMKIIRAVPNSYLLIKGNGDQEVLKNLFTTIAEEEKVDPSRLRFLNQTPTAQMHRANLQIADIVLDTYPYNGATTTLETLWAGIPLVTRVGEQFAARNSYTFMMNVGVTEGIAYSEKEYIEWGIKLGTDESLRQKVAWKIRQSRQTSPLWKGKQFTREMEKAYEQMWNIHLNKH